MVKITLPYSCGELVQGRLEGVDFHVPCPIAREGSVEAWWGEGSSCDIQTLPPKARAAALRVSAEPGGAAPEGPLRVRLHSRAATGKGLASSSVDVLGTILAVGRLLGHNLGGAEASRMAVEIEPTDGIGLPGISLFDHRHGGWRQALGGALPLGLVAIEPRVEIDTLAFNQRDASPAQEDAGLWREAIAMVRQGLAAADASMLARAATLSALHWQRVLHNPWLAPALSWGRRQGALGICRAHSGTVVGILFPPGWRLTGAAVDLQRQTAGKARVWITRLANGGVR